LKEKLKGNFWSVFNILWMLKNQDWYFFMCRFRACLLQISLQDVNLASYESDVLKVAKPPPSLLTFGDLDGRELQFPSASKLRPFKRALCFQAHLAVRKAREHIQAGETGWRTIDLTEYWSEAGSYVEKVKAWLADSPSGYAGDLFEVSAHSTWFCYVPGRWNTVFMGANKSLKSNRKIVLFLG